MSAPTSSRGRSRTRTRSRPNSRALADVCAALGTDKRKKRIPLFPVDAAHLLMAAKTRSACKRAGLEPLTFHSLRATYATLTADAGLPITKLSALLGHADAATTAIYIRPESSRAAVDPRAILGGSVSAPSAQAGDRELN